jgi:hypothetical protein
MMMETTMIPMALLFTIHMIIYMHVMFTFLAYYFICALHVVDLLSQ